MLSIKCADPPIFLSICFFFFNDTATTEIYTLSLHDALPIWMLLFGQIFNRIARFPDTQQAFGGKSYFQFFVPAVLLQTLLFGAAQSGIGIINDMQSGFLSKLLTTPVHRMAILLG